jgi:MFS family permease
VNTTLTPRELTAGFRFIWAQPYLRAFLIFFGMGLNAAFGGVMLVAITGAAQADPSGRSSGAIIALGAAGYLVGALLAPRMRAHHRPRAMPVLTCWISAAVVTLLAAITTPLAMGALLAVALFVAALTNVAFDTEQLRLTPDHLTGWVGAATMLIALAAQPAGPLAGGLLVGEFGPRIAFLVLGMVIVATATILTLLLGGVPRPPAPTCAGASRARPT